MKIIEREYHENLLHMPRNILLSPPSVIPSMVNSYFKSLSRIVNEDLLAYVTDFSFGKTIQFRISFAGFGFLDFGDKQTAQSRISAMGREGYVIETFFPLCRYRLPDCSKNRKMLKRYCREILGGDLVKVSILRDYITGISVSISSGALQAPESGKNPIERTKENLSILAARTGLTLRDISLREFSRLDIWFADSLFSQALKNNRKNQNKIMTAVKAVLPCAECVSVKTTLYQGSQYISEIHIKSIDPLNIKRILNSSELSQD